MKKRILKLLEDIDLYYRDSVLYVVTVLSVLSFAFSIIALISAR